MNLDHPNPLNKYNIAVHEAQVELQGYRQALHNLRLAKLAREAARLGYEQFADAVLFDITTPRR